MFPFFRSLFNNQETKKMNRWDRDKLEKNRKMKAESYNGRWKHIIVC